MIRKILLPVWAGLSCLLLVPSVMVLLVSPGRMNALAAAASVPHRECPLCGMTRGYVEMARGNVRAAWELNRAAPFWFSAGLVSGGAAVVYLALAWRRGRRAQARRAQEAEASGTGAGDAS